jgi:hypothetical protein
MRMFGTLLFVASAIVLLSAGPVLAQETAFEDAPMATAPPESEAMQIAMQAHEPELLPPPVDYGPWLSPKPAVPCFSTQTFGLQRGRRFLYQVDVAPGKLIAQNTAAVACPFGAGYVVTAEIGAATLVSTEGTYGRRGMAEEQWAEFTGTKAMKTWFGTFELTTSLAYNAHDAGRGLQGMADDYSKLGIKLAYPIKFSGWEITLAYANEKLNPIGSNNSLNLRGPMARLVTPSFFGGWLEFNGANIRDENSTGATAHKNAWFIDGFFKKALGFGLTLGVGFRVDQYTQHDAKFGRCVQRDAKIVLCPRADGGSTALPLFKPMIQISRRKEF